MIRQLPWGIIGIVTFLFLLEFGMHPLTFGPDRWIHDPGVYRINDPHYLVGDWYTEMAAASGVYVFYAKIIQIGEILQIDEERWRQLLYFLCLFGTYYSIWKISERISAHRWVVPLIAFLHAAVMMLAPPFWMYGKFIQVDGGVAPRIIGSTLSFLALYFLLQGRRWAPWVLLGIATLIHVSNSLIVFTLFLGSWVLHQVAMRYSEIPWKRLSREVLSRASTASIAYILAGGWFALYIAYLNRESGEFSETQFIWTWIYFRAPYMALSRVPTEFWLIFSAHVAAILVGWYLLKKSAGAKNKKDLGLLTLIAFGSVAYLFVFYLFSIIYPWLPGFQFYSIRVIYFAYFVAYLFSALVVAEYYKPTIEILKKTFDQSTRIKKSGMTLLLVGCFVAFSYYSFWIGVGLIKKIPGNLQASWVRFVQAETMPEQLATIEYIYAHPEPVLSPVASWSLPQGSRYLPLVVTVKCFGFTKSGLEEWSERLDDIGKGILQTGYEQQLARGKFKTLAPDWITIYRNLSTEDIIRLSEKYNFHLFLTYRDLEYPFQVVAEDGEYRLYRLR